MLFSCLNVTGDRRKDIGEDAPSWVGWVTWYFHLKGPTAANSWRYIYTHHIPFVIESTCRSRLFPFLMPNTGWLWWCRYIQVDKSTKTTLRICKKQQLEICLASPLNCYIQTIVIFKSRIECWVTFRVLYQDQRHWSMALFPNIWNRSVWMTLFKESVKELEKSFHPKYFMRAQKLPKWGYW